MSQAGTTKKKPVRRSNPRANPPRKAPPKNAKRAPSGPGRWLGFFLSGALLFLLLAGSAYYALVRGFGNAPGPGTGKVVELDLPEGLSPKEAAELLEGEGLVSSAQLFSLYLRVLGKGASFRPGPHLLNDTLSPQKLVRRLERSQARETVRITLPEGVHRFAIAKRLEEAEVCSSRAFLEATTDEELLSELGIEGDSAEGFLFPATYELFADSDARDIVRRLKGELDRRLEKLENLYGEAALELRQSLRFGRREIVTLASMIEKEAAVDEERPLVASVFLNRLRDPKFLPRQRLQSDVTTAYGCIAFPEGVPSCANYQGRVTGEMNNDAANRYSTYRHSHLPPGPIANPGERSLEAVFAPAKTKYFYFVARGQGRHAFSETLDQHREAIRAGR